MSEVSYVLPPTEEMYDVLLQGLKRFSDDLQTGATDSSALGYGWSPAPFAAKISAPRLLRPKPPSLSLSLRDAEVRPPGPASARTTMHSTPERPRRPSSAGQRNEEPLPRMSGRGPNAAQTASELKLKAQGQQLTLPPPKSSRQRSQKNLHMAKPFKTNALMQPPVQPGTGTTDRAERAERAERTGPTSASQLSPQVLPAMHKQPRSLEEHIASSSQRLLPPGKPTLVWKTVDSEADYRQLRAGEYFNHFQQNRVLTTKAGLAQSLKEHSTSSGVNADDFFPRCYDTAQKSERDDFILDFRRSSALRVALLHRRIRRDHLEGLSSSYMCNETILDACHLVLQRWLCDLDPEHLDEDDAVTAVSGLSEETWEALTLYSTLAQSELLGTSEPQRPRLERSRLAEAALPLKRWPEFLSHRWGPGESESLEAVLTRLESLFPQWSLHGGWLGQNVWIVKPGTNSKGSGIECFSKLTELLQHVDRMPNRICQKYVERPLLLFSGRKFDIRQWVLVRSVQPLKVFLFSECYLRLCNGMYDLGDLRDRERHISNWQVNKHGKNVVEGAVVSLQDFREELEALTGLQEYWERHLLPQLKHIVIEVMRASRDLLTPRTESFELFGFDVMVDEAMKLWLLEVNLSPGCDSRTSFMEKMLTRMSHRLVEVAVLGREEPDGEEPDWIKIYDDSGQAAAASGPPRSAEDLRIQGTQLRIGKTKGASKPQEAHVAFAEEAERSPHEAKDKVRKGTGYVTLSELPDEEESGVTFEVGQVQQDSGETRKSVRKGTGFLHPSDLPDDDEEEEEEREVRFTTPQEAGVGGSPKEKVRKGTGYVALSDLPDDEEETNRGVSFEVASQASNGQGETRKSVRKGTGFLHPSDLPDDDEEEEEEREVRFTTPQAAGVGGSPKEKVRKGTGYVALSDLPDDEEETNRGVSFEVNSQASNGQGETRKSVRKGTGFLHPSDLPDDDEEEEEEREVRFTTPQAAGVGGSPKEKVRKGTGYVALSDLPDDEEDSPSRAVSIQAEGEEGQPKPKVRQDTGSVSMSELPEEGSVSFNLKSKAGQTSGEPKEKVRKGTGFVSLSDLPPSDDEDVAPSVSFQVKEGGGQPKVKAAVRKGTGFVDASEILDDEEEDEESRVRFEAGTDTGEAKVQKVKKARRDTGFVSHSDIPDEEEVPSADVVPEGSKQKAKKGAVFVDPNDLPDDDAEDGVRFNLPAEVKTKPAGPKVKARRGTGFVQESELPPEDREEDPDAAVSFLPSKSGSPAGKAKKGTGFVNLADLPPSDDEDDAARVSFQVDGGSGTPRPKKAVRKGTGFVDASEIPDEEEEHNVKFAAGTDGEAAAKQKKARRGTGFVQESELPPDDSQETSVNFDLPAQAKASETPKAKVRKGTGFVNAADLPVSDEEEEVTTSASLKAKKGGAVVVSPSDLPPDEDEDVEDSGVTLNVPKVPADDRPEEASVSFDLPVQTKKSSEKAKTKVRKDTGFVNAADLPVSDEEEEEVTATASVKARKGGAVVVNPNDLPPDDDEEESERAVRFNAAETAVPHPKARRGTGFVAEAELPEDDEEFEDDFEEESGGEESP